MSEPTELPERIQRELDEALRRAGADKLPSQPGRKRRSFRLPVPDPRPKNPGQLVLIGVGLFVLAYLLPLPFRLEIYLASFICVGVALFTYWMKPYGGGQKTWRGSPMSLPPSSWQERLYSLIYRRS